MKRKILTGQGGPDGTTNRTVRLAAIGFVAAALGTLVVGWSRDIPMASILPLALLVGLLFAVGNVLVERRRDR